jgi:hypothetical protein
MSLLTVEGVYKDGRVELAERPDHVVEATGVIVTFLTASGVPEKPMVDASRERARKITIIRILFVLTRARLPAIARACQPVPRANRANYEPSRASVRMPRRALLGTRLSLNGFA